MNQDRLLDDIFTNRTTDTRASQDAFTQYKEKLKNSNFGSQLRDYSSIGPAGSENRKIDDSGFYGL